MNIYAYVGNNPVNAIDPWGLAKAYYGRDCSDLEIVNGEYQLTDDFLYAVHERAINKIEDMPPWEIINPFAYISTDGFFRHNKKKRYRYNNISYDGSQINYYLQGYFHHHVGWPKWISRKIVQGWKGERHKKGLDPNVEYWWERGYDEYKDFDNVLEDWPSYLPYPG